MSFPFSNRLYCSDDESLEEHANIRLRNIYEKLTLHEFGDVLVFSNREGFGSWANMRKDQYEGSRVLESEHIHY